MLPSCRSTHPSILWAQRNDTVLLTVSLNDIHHEKYSLEEKVFKFSGVGGAEGHQYNVEINFYKDVIPQVFWSCLPFVRSSWFSVIII